MPLPVPRQPWRFIAVCVAVAVTAGCSSGPDPWRPPRPRTATVPMAIGEAAGWAGIGHASRVGDQAGRNGIAADRRAARSA